MQKYIIGIDGGSQSTKIIIFDLDGKIVCEGKQNLRPMVLSEQGYVEHPDDDLWTSLVAASRQAMSRFSGNPEDIVGLGLCTIRCCRVLLREDGTLVAPVMNWMDIRLSKPYEHQDPVVKYVTTTTGYITHRLTGKFNDTVANYEGQWPIDKNTWQWSDDPEVFKKFNIPREMLFNLQMPGEISGHVTAKVAEITGIPAGIPVVATANDKAVEALGAGLLAENSALISLGTYIAAMVHGHENLKEAMHFFTNLAAIPHNYLYESSGIRRGMWTVSWMKDLLGDEIVQKAKALGISVEAYLNREAEKVPAGSNGLMTVLDWLAPPKKPYKKGIIIGFDGRHTGAHLFRSIVEGIVLTMKNYTDAMCGELGIKLANLIISGGGANGDLFMQVFADVFGIPASRTAVSDSASLGAAISVAVAVDVYPDYQTAIVKMVKVRDIFQPIEKHTCLYERMNLDVYKNITHYTDKILKKSYPLFG